MYTLSLTMMKLFSVSLFLLSSTFIVDAQNVSEACKAAFDALYADNADLQAATDTYDANYKAMIDDYEPANQCEGELDETTQFKCNFPVVENATEVQTACDAINGTTFVSGSTYLKCSLINDNYVYGRVVEMNFPNQLACVPTPPCTEDDVKAYTAYFESEAEMKVQDMFYEEPIVDSVTCGADVTPNPDGKLIEGSGAGRATTAFVSIVVAGFAYMFM